MVEVLLFSVAGLVLLFTEVLLLLSVLCGVVEALPAGRATEVFPERALSVALGVVFCRVLNSASALLLLGVVLRTEVLLVRIELS